jgi:bifunctional DNA-binding transcriptional regulator/antitoxin component of YhaV-PrlF toxin-antitoxin module
MTFIVKTKTSTLPAAVRQQAGFKLGQELEFKVSGGVVTVLPKFPTADDEYTPEQRAIIDAQLAEGLADIKAGRVYGPFDTHEEMMKSLRSHGKKAKAKTSKRTVR